MDEMAVYLRFLERRPRLVVARASGTSVLRIVKPHVVIGRHTSGRGLLGEQPDVTIPDVTVSPRHAEIALGPSGPFRIRDAGSASCVLLNGSKVHSWTELRCNDWIALGAVDLLFVEETRPQDPCARLESREGVTAVLRYLVERRVLRRRRADRLRLEVLRKGERRLVEHLVRCGVLAPRTWWALREELLELAGA
jgi:pSer/pThr/pTyr-binding forkhead associated (FHA) protein